MCNQKKKREERRSMSKLQRLLLATAALTFCFGSLSKTCRAEEQKHGSLKINNQVIYENNNQKKNSEANFVVPDLFLPAKEDMEKEIKKKREMIIKEAKNDVFMMDDQSKEMNISQKVIPHLFKQKELLSYVKRSGGNKEKLQSSEKILIFLGIILSSAILLTMGIFLGNRFSYHREIKE